MKAAHLLHEFKYIFKPQQGVVLDLACGQGRNGLALVEQGIDVLFSDINPQCLLNIKEINKINDTSIWCADFESEQKIDSIKLSNMELQGCIIFNYLHRPLFDSIIKAVKPGGFVIYETFTEHNRQFGRPNRDDFLLKTGELKSRFKHWNILFYFEGIKHNPDRVIAQIICQKPTI